MVTLPIPIQADRRMQAVALRLSDALLILATLWAAVGSTAPWDLARCWEIGSVALGCFVVAAEVAGLYRNWRGARCGRPVLAVVGTWGLTVSALAILGFVLAYSGDLPRRTIVMWTMAAPLALIASRTCTSAVRRWLARCGWHARRCAIVGVNPLAIQLARNLQAAPELGLSLVGFYDDRASERTESIPAGLPQEIAGIEQLVEDARRGHVETVYISFPMRAEDRIRHDVLDRLADSTTSVYIVPDFFVFELLHARWTDIGGLPAVSVFENPLYGVDGLAKRIMDLFFGTLFLAIAAPAMLIIAMLIKCTSRGPIFFRQKRYGLDGREVRVWKFRSMTVCEDGGRVSQATRGDQRITPLGRILRKTSLDEFPQLLNVLSGSMSLVGPRPHANAHNEQYRKLIPGYMLRHKVKPGITGLAQVRGWRGETDTLEKMEHRIECDHEYIRQWSLWGDLKILFQTIFVVLSQNNAY